MHLSAAAGAPGVCLFAQDWTPEMAAELGSIWHPSTRLGRAAPRGDAPIVVLAAPEVEAIAVDDVKRAVKALGVLPSRDS
jgi:ADP-heptose:LPS heptosyltransferase